jgi:hypothetical protein
MLFENMHESTNFFEKWVRIEFAGLDFPPHYEVSNFGRLKSFQTNPQKGTIIKGSVIQGYRSLNIRVEGSKSINRYIHKLVSELFVNRPFEAAKYVIHKDFDKQNNRYDNLKWATLEEMTVHNYDNPAVINRKIPTRTSNYKLTEAKVIVIKKMLKSDKPNRLKMIAKQFGITHTQLNRIRKGENWKNVTID